MAFTSANGLITNLVNYQGRFILTSNTRTPLTTFLGARDLENGGGFEHVGAMKFAMSQSSALDAASQPAVTENQTFTAGTAKVNIPTQNLNYCQVYRHDVKISKMKLNDRSISGQAIDGEALLLQLMDPQLMLGFKQIKRNYEYVCLQGTGQDGSSSSDTAFKTQGILTGISTNVEAAGGAVFSKDLLNAVLVAMADGGAEFINMQLHCQMDLKQAISAAYGLPIRSVSMGGVNITTIETDAGPVDVVYSPQMPADTIGIFDMDFCSLKSNHGGGDMPVDIFNIPFSGVGEQAELYGQLGFDYGVESKHGKITNVVAS